MKSGVSVSFLIACFVSAIAQTEPVFVSGKVEFKVKNMGLDVSGTMNVIAIQFKQPSADPATWSLEGSAAPETISTGIALRDKHLKKSDYFDIEKYPVIRLQSTGIKAKGKDNYEGTFSLMLKGITKTVVIPFTVLKKDTTNNIEAEFSINRLDFGLGEESSILKDNVKIRVNVQIVAQ